MFKKIVNQLKELANEKNTLSIDPAAFGDPVAMTTEWTPLSPGGSSIRTHRLHQASATRREFRVTAGALLFCGIFIFVGVVAFGIATFGVDEKRWLLMLFGIVFGGAGGALWFLSAPAVFDREREYYYKGRKNPERLFDPSVLENYAPLKEIHALQIISEHVRGDKSSYHSYELNLILKGGSRLNVVDHGNLKALRQDAAMLADFLSVPLWDAA